MHDRIPSWIGRAVTTAEVPARFIGLVDSHLKQGEIIPDTADRAWSPDLSSTVPYRQEISVPSPAAKLRDGEFDGTTDKDENGEFDSSEYMDASPPGEDSTGRLVSSPGAAGRGRFIATASIVLFLILGTLAAAGLLRARSQVDAEATDTTVDAASTDTRVDEPADPPEAPDVAVTDSPTIDADPMAVPGLTGPVIEAHRGQAWAAGEAAWAIFTDGNVHLQGQVPDEAAADLLAERFQSIGLENVVPQLTIDPTSPEPTDPPLFIKETVEFAPQSTAMPPGSDWILDMAETVMASHPSTTLTVVVDQSAPIEPGDEADLASRRVEAIIIHMRNRGIDAARLDVEIRNDDLGGVEAGIKPIEFVIRGLLEEN